MVTAASSVNHDMPTAPLTTTRRLDSVDGLQQILTPGQDGIRWLGLDLLRLPPGEILRHRHAEREMLSVVLSGTCAATAGDRTFEHLGRSNVFTGPPDALYVSAGTELTIEAETPTEVALISAVSARDSEPVEIKADQIDRISVGEANWRRDIRLVIPPGSQISHRLIVGETLNPPGNWSGIAPHKHDEATDEENALEELYLFKTNPSDGFGIQVSYRDGTGSGHLIGNDHVVFIHRGYHPTVAAPGTTLFYLWALAGDQKDYRISLDPRFDWLANTEAILAETRRGNG
jgi:5-deoxy-glucuronate isomerase